MTENFGQESENLFPSVTADQERIEHIRSLVQSKREVQRASAPDIGVENDQGLEESGGPGVTGGSGWRSTPPRGAKRR